MQSCFAACSQVVCVAEDTAVAFYAPKSLRKFRVERLNGSRVCGMYVQSTSSAKAVLHVIDAEATLFEFAIEGGAPSLVRTISIRLPPASPVPSTSAGENEEVSDRRHQGSTSRTVNGEAAATASVVVAAQFHVQQAQLFAVLLTKAGLYEAALGSASPVGATNAPSAVVVHTFKEAVPHGYLSVGQFTGLVVVAVPHAREFFYSLFTDRLSAHQPHRPSCPPLLPRTVNVQIQSIACSPISTSVAVGGRRGELLICVEVQEAHCFADHWHHTPLTALAFALDGSAVYTGGRESVLLIWDLVSYSHKKVKVQLGTLQRITPFSSGGAQLLLSCGTSTLAVADLLQMRVTTSAEGIEWAAEDVCTGLVVEQWRGSPAVILTGMPNVLRVCDPYTQQSIYSLHVSSQMETIPSPPRHGIQFVGILNDSRSLVTYESFSSTVLPPLLRFWEYDAPRKQHIETQTVYSPHRSAVLALQVEKRGRRVFTLSSEAMKCWAQTAFTAQDTYGTPTGGWHNHSAMATPSQQVQTMALSADGSLCFVADDCLHVYSVQDCRPGVHWPLLQLLPQYTETQPLRRIVVSPDCRHAVAAGKRHIFFWTLGRCAEEPAVFSVGESCITAFSAFTDTTVVAALEDTSLVELRCCAAGSSKGPQLGEAVRRIANASRFPLRHIAPLHMNGQRLAAVDAVTGFKILQLPTGAPAVAQPSVYEWAGTSDEESSAGAVAEGDKTARLQLQSFFKEMTSIQDSQELMVTANQEGALATAQQTAQADRWLAEVLGEPAYTAPPMSAILSTYLQRRPY
ncbi:conserved hypothetical protein [Leishmania major strain Friedlin]|uniref:Uncharacterized protein n=1 Tax=Leishmania major TaxID=5664 RepID=Q4Q8M4_LEIMA|nr:conserved hypothetical protein [Leishmania major strain Friedlin]CAG9577108.1 hypothetical_protein_-_conserved [Leishmania major strain Friedlin]CAJ04981.1 conserved hypothetical protein [Leishmania major strain Friedlin]|eukprot:XP_001684324.1 conserved hypothetical protein [Leishmania major strain Friedlin]